jgi:WD40 repeat protein
MTCNLTSRAVRLSNDTLVTGSDDWTACVWGAASGLCGSVLACHSGGVTSVDFTPGGDGILTGENVQGALFLWALQLLSAKLQVRRGTRSRLVHSYLI